MFKKGWYQYAILARATRLIIRLANYKIEPLKRVPLLEDMGQNILFRDDSTRRSEEGRCGAFTTP
jgi:hypothetical protein